MLTGVLLDLTARNDRAFIFASLKCACGRIFDRLIEAGYGIDGKPATLSPTCKFSCVECNRGKCSPRESLTPETQDAIIRYAKQQIADGNKKLSVDDLAWTLHVKKDAVVEAIRQWGLHAEDYSY
jgi:hypothetical protein